MVNNVRILLECSPQKQSAIGLLQAAKLQQLLFLDTITLHCIDLVHSNMHMCM